MPALLFALLICQCGSFVDYASEDSVDRYDLLVGAVLWWSGIPALLIALLIFINEEREFKSLKILDFILATVAGICLLLLPPLDARLDQFRETRTSNDESTINTFSNQLNTTRIQLTNALAQSRSASDEADSVSKKEKSRGFTDFQKTYGKSMLAPLAGTSVTIMSLEDDSESHNFQQILNTFLNDADLKSTVGGTGTYFPDPKGIIISFREASDKDKCRLLAEFLNSCDLTVHINPSPSESRLAPAGAIVIIVGTK